MILEKPIRATSPIHSLVDVIDDDDDDDDDDNDAVVVHDVVGLRGDDALHHFAFLLQSYPLRMMRPWLYCRQGPL